VPPQDVVGDIGGIEELVPFQEPSLLRPWPITTGTDRQKPARKSKNAVCKEVVPVHPQNRESRKATASKKRRSIVVKRVAQFNCFSGTTFGCMGEGALPKDNGNQERDLPRLPPMETSNTPTRVH